MHRAAKDWSEPIVLKKSCLIDGSIADSIPLLIGGFAVDANLIRADVQKQNSSNSEGWAARVVDADEAPRAVQEYLDTLDNEAFGAATTTKPKLKAHADPVSQWTAARKGPAFFAYFTNYLIDTDHSINVDVDASRSREPLKLEPCAR
jgi:hypothetical protein